MVYEELLPELKSQLERIIQVKERLDTKANNMITMSATVATVFMGFGIFLLSDVDIMKNWFLSIFATISLLAEIIFTVITIKYCLDSYKLRNYYHPVGTQVFYDESGNSIDTNKIEPFKNSSDEIKILFIREYLTSINSFEYQNKEQTIGINKGQRTFISATITIPVFAFCLVLLKYIV